MPTNPASNNLSDRLVASVSQSDPARTSPGLYRALLRLLARGEPVAVADLATIARRPTSEVQRIVAGWTDTEYDGQGRIVGYVLTLRPTPHQFMVDGRQLYTWCALDTLFLPAVIQRPARVESPCATTGTPVRLTVDPAEGITALDPATAVVSIVTPEQVISVRANFCSPGRFFATLEAARGWQAKHPGMHVVSVADAYEASRPLSQTLLNETNPDRCCAC